MVKIVVVRHAKTAWNRAGRIQGRSDIPLADESVGETRRRAADLKSYDFAAVYSSPLARARRTAELLTEGRGLDITEDERLIERDFGKYDGRTYEELKMEDHNRLFYLLDDDSSAEPAEKVFSRMKSFLRDMAERHDGQTVLAVTHGVATSYLVYAASHESFSPDDYEMTYIRNLTATEVTAGE